MRLRFRYVSVEYGRSARSNSMQRVGWSRYFPMPYTQEEVWRPPTDVYETDEHIVVMMELAGVREEDIEVTIFNDILIVAGAREDAGRPDRVLYHEMGISFGRFRSEVFLPLRVNPECVDANYENGFLTIRLLKSCQS